MDGSIASTQALLRHPRDREDSLFRANWSCKWQTTLILALDKSVFVCDIYFVGHIYARKAKVPRIHAYNTCTALSLQRRKQSPYKYVYTYIYKSLIPFKNEATSRDATSRYIDIQRRSHNFRTKTQVEDEKKSAAARKRKRSAFGAKSLSRTESSKALPAASARRRVFARSNRLPRSTRSLAARNLLICFMLYLSGTGHLPSLTR